MQIHLCSEVVLLERCSVDTVEDFLRHSWDDSACVPLFSFNCVRLSCASLAIGNDATIIALVGEGSGKEGRRGGEGRSGQSAETRARERERSWREDGRKEGEEETVCSEVDWLHSLYNTVIVSNPTSLSVLPCSVNAYMLK